MLEFILLVAPTIFLFFILKIYNQEVEKRKKIEKSIREKESFRQTLLKEKSIKLNYTTELKLPPGQREVKNWIVLDLGIRPNVNLKKYQLKFEGLQGEIVFFSLEDIKLFGIEEFKTDFHCYTSWSYLNMKWEGVSLKKILKKLKPREDWKYMIQYGADGYTTSCPRDVIESENVFITWKVNDEELSLEHGIIRIIIPNHYGSKGSKYLEKIEFSVENKKGFWEQRGYHDRANVWREERLDKGFVNKDKTLEMIINEYNDGEFLDISGIKLNEISLEIFKFNRVACLSLNNNLITKLPDEIVEMKRLIRLNLNQNKLKQLPKTIGELQFLSELYVFENELIDLPDEIVKLKFLGVLGLDRNKLKKLPEKIGEMTNLTALFCDYNELEELPVSISDLPNIQALMFTGCPLKRIPYQFYKLKHLRFFGLTSGLPEEVISSNSSEIIAYISQLSLN